jgi:DNA/RNA endonuclease YhcR with UshA esterase domain
MSKKTPTQIGGIKMIQRLTLSCIAVLGFCSLSLSQAATVIPANEAAAHIGEYATVEGVVAKVFTSKSGNTFLNIGATYPNQTFTGWIPPASPVNKSSMLSGIEGKHVKITGRIEMYKDKPEIRINAVSQLVVE